MKKLFVIIFIGMLSNIFAAEKIKYITDSILQKDGNYLKLLGGSSWELTQMSLALPTQDVIIVFHTFLDKQNQSNVMPVFYSDGEEIPLRYISGLISAEEGYLVTIMQKYNDGAILQTDDGYKLSIPQYDRYDTGWWLPPYKALITGNQMYMWNLKKGKRVWIDSISE